MRRGEVWWADLGDPRGSEPGLRRPVVVVQDDLLTKSALETVMVVPLTSNLRRSLAVGNVTLDADATGLARPSVALVCQVMTVDKAYLTDLAGSLPPRARRAVDAGLRLALSLTVLVHVQRGRCDEMTPSQLKKSRVTIRSSGAAE